MRTVILFGMLVLALVSGWSGAWMASAAVAQPAEYQTQASCHAAGVANFAGVPAAVNTLITEAARGGWQLVAMTAVSPTSATAPAPGVCVLLTFRRG